MGDKSAIQKFLDNFCGGCTLRGAESCYANEKTECVYKDAAKALQTQNNLLRPQCYKPEKDNPYPLCIGRGLDICPQCCLWVNYDQREV